MYQILSYGYRYQQAGLQCKNIFLIYPAHSEFKTVLPSFDLHPENLSVWAIPFNLLTYDGEPEGLDMEDLYKLSFS